MPLDIMARPDLPERFSNYDPGNLEQAADLLKTFQVELTLAEPPPGRHSSRWQFTWSYGTIQLENRDKTMAQLVAALHCYLWLCGVPVNVIRKLALTPAVEVARRAYLKVSRQR
jgi:hypothetical protein